jgi:hypothetical protein
LAEDHVWHTFRATVTTTPSTTHLALHLYAGAPSERKAVVDYRDISFRVFPAVQVGVGPGLGSPPPNTTVNAVSPTELRVRVQDADSATMVVLPEAYAPGWQLTSSSRNASDVRHLTADGYANAWLIPWTGSYDVTLRYAPERIARAARIFDLVLVPIVLGTTVGAVLFKRIRLHRLERPTRTHRLPS